ncbi:hypothetical protein TNCV_4045571 [Trichonephila clavipes]|nr:hypothetical protein TNCV_4045571 [Trichonephila clavipes]
MLTEKNGNVLSRQLISFHEMLISSKSGHKGSRNVGYTSFLDGEYLAIATALEQFLASELKKLPGIKNCLEFQPIGIL